MRSATLGATHQAPENLEARGAFLGDLLTGWWPPGPGTKGPMTVHAHPLALKEISKEQEWNLPQVRALTSAYRCGRLCLIVGAGVSKGCGLPVWSELNRRLLRRALEGLYEAVGPEEAPLHARDIEATLADRVRPMVGRYLKAKLGSRYLDEVRAALYEGPARLSRTVRAVLEMENLYAVLTANFDDLLETFARELGADDRYQAVFSAPISLQPGKIPIYHTHGYLPADRRAEHSEGLVLSEDDYHGLLHQGYHWTDHVALQLLARTTCLLVGTSGEDPNLRRLLDLARGLASPLRHYILLKPPAPLPRDARSAIRYSASRRAVWDAFDHLGLEVLWIHNYDRDITGILKRIGECG